MIQTPDELTRGIKQYLACAKTDVDAEVEADRKLVFDVRRLKSAMVAKGMPEDDFQRVHCHLLDKKLLWEDPKKPEFVVIRILASTTYPSARRAKELLEGKQIRPEDLAGFKFDVQTPPQPPSGPYFWLGVGLTAVTVGLCVWGFSLKELEPHQRGILSFFCALTGGFAAWLFSGKALFRMSLARQSFVTGTAGFAIFLVTFFLLFSRHSPEPPVLEISKFDLLSEKSAEKMEEGWVLKSYEHRLNTQYEIVKESDLKVAFALAVRGFNTQRSGRIRLTPSISLKKEGRVLWRGDFPTYQNINDWRSKKGILSIGEEPVLKGLCIGHDEIDSWRAVPFLILLADFDKDDVPAGNVLLSVEMVDEVGSRQTVTRDQAITVKWKTSDTGGSKVKIHP